MAKTLKRTESASVIDSPPSNSQSSDTGRSTDRDRIATRAYELYLARGCADGGDFEDWLTAEREIAAGNGNASRGDAGE